MRKMNLLSILLCGLVALTGFACGGEDGGPVDIEAGLLGYWIESDQRGLITADGDGYAWGVVFKEDGNMIRVRWDLVAETLVEDANGPFDRVDYAIEGQFRTREGSLGTYEISAATLSTQKTYPLLITVDGGVTAHYLMVANPDGSSPEMDPLWDCSSEDHDTYLADAQQNSDSLGPIADGCYPVALNGTLTFESDFADPRVPEISVTFSGGEMTAINGVACEAVFPGQAKTFSDCEIELMCGCCRVYFEAQDYNSRYKIDFPRSGSMDACEHFVFSGAFIRSM